MLVRRAHVLMLAAALCLGAGFLSAEGEEAESEHPMDIDFLFNYYNQDGEHSPVTGGVGTEAMDVVGPLVVLNWQVNDDWTLEADLGADTISSASVDAMDDHLSTASELDTRAYTAVTMTHETPKQTWGFTGGLSVEYDYSSLIAGLSWSRDFRQETTTLGAALRHYADTVDLYDIDGVNRGEDSRSTTDVSLSLTQVLGRRTVGTVEVSLSDQSGFLSTPFHEVILQAPGGGEGEHVAERLPDARRRTALGLRLNHAFTPRLVGRFGVRAYDDDWGIQATTVELEPHFKLAREHDTWIFPILRFHDQTGSDYFAPPETFAGFEDFFTADRDLSTFTSQKYGLGWKWDRGSGKRVKGWNRFETRITYYTRDDGLESISTSFHFGRTLR
jgi:hypothetical protein